MRSRAGLTLPRHSTTCMCGSCISTRFIKQFLLAPGRTDRTLSSRGRNPGLALCDATHRRRGGENLQSSRQNQDLGLSFLDVPGSRPHPNTRHCSDHRQRTSREFVKLVGQAQNAMSLVTAAQQERDEAANHRAAGGAFVITAHKNTVLKAFVNLFSETTRSCQKGTGKGAL